jgi:NAD(P)-dependent dehydrogenase (short-subunit alcohol dehydrogenase family)
MAKQLEGRRILVVGASSGLGRATAIAASAAGARVALAARRTARLDEAAEEAGNGAVVVPCDVCDEASVQAAVRSTLARLGGLDALVYAPGIATFQPIAEVDAETWRAVLDTNLVGPALVTRAALPHLEAARGKAVYFSSIVIDDAPPRPLNAPYVVSKVALESLVRAFQGEHRKVGFTTIALGDTITEFGQESDPALLAGLVERWTRQDYMYGRTMNAEGVAVQVVGVLAATETVRRLAITPSYADASD